MEVDMKIEVTPEEHRERIVLKAIDASNISIKDAEHLDALVCDALGLDPNENPPDFILLAQK
jgi:hypothetical protein